MWIANPILSPGHDLRETDVTINVHVNREYKNRVATNLNGGKPMYGWSMDDIKTSYCKSGRIDERTGYHQRGSESVLRVLRIRTFRAWTTRVKITNLPDQCTVTIYNVSGKLIRTFKKDNQDYIDRLGSEKQQRNPYFERRLYHSRGSAGCGRKDSEVLWRHASGGS